VIDTNLDNYFHADYPTAGGTERRIVNLNSQNSDDFKDLVGMTNAIAKEIARRQYSDRDDFIAAMDEHDAVKRTNASGVQIWHAMMSTAGVKLVFE